MTNMVPCYRIHVDRTWRREATISCKGALPFEPSLQKRNNPGVKNAMSQ